VSWAEQNGKLAPKTLYVHAAKYARISTKCLYRMDNAQPAASQHLSLLGSQHPSISHFGVCLYITHMYVRWQTTDKWQASASLHLSIQVVVLVDFSRLTMMSGGQGDVGYSGTQLIWVLVGDRHRLPEGVWEGIIRRAVQYVWECKVRQCSFFCHKKMGTERILKLVQTF